MNNPRDFLPSRYRRIQSEEAAISPSNSFSIPTDLTESKKQINPKRGLNSKIASLFVILFLIIGVFSSYLLSQQNQDVRQQASEACDEGDPYCGPDGRCKPGYVMTGGACEPIPTTTATPGACQPGQIKCSDGSCATPGKGAPDPCPSPPGSKCTSVTEPGPKGSCDENGNICKEYRQEQKCCDDNGANCHWYYQGSVFDCKHDESCDNTTTTTPPTAPPTTITQPPTVTTTAPAPICSNIEILDSTGTVMTGDADKNLKNGDQVKFRATATNTSNAAVTYEFRIWAPNMSTWINITNTNSASGAANVSAAYTIISSGRHVAQSRICISGVCQAWETVTGAPDTIQTGTACTSDVSCAAGYYCYIDPTPSGAQTLVAPTGNYCKAKQNCTTDANCATGQTCYQPPMPTCPSGMGCVQVMPAAFCKEK